jgi:hypothetical protein
MSSVIVAGNTSGSVTLDAPAVSGSTVITLPTTSGTMATLTTPSFTTTIGVGNATPSTSGAGITFPATQSASTNANTLDDYEEGTWTPVFTPASGAIGSYNAQSGIFTKVGRAVTVTCYLAVNSKGTASGALVLTGLPFANNSGSGAYVSCSMYMNVFASGPSGNFVSYLAPSTTQVSLAYLAGQTTTTQITSAMISNGTDFMISMTYMTA